MERTDTAETEAFAADYESARQAFSTAGQGVTARLLDLPIVASGPDGLPLGIDVARVGSSDPEWAVIVTGGLHGVEGIFGSAVQVAWMRSTAATQVDANGIVVLVHAVNPFGFAWRRRVNEDNIDLNRNFLPPGGSIPESPPGYVGLNGLLNPDSPPGKLELFALRAVANILRTGFTQFKNTVATGQYDFPDGLFFGGRKPSESVAIVQNGFWDWVGTAKRVVHLDLHTGLGRHGDHTLLLVDQPGSIEEDWYRDRFDPKKLEPLKASGGTAYVPQGMVGGWAKANAGEREYRYIAAEFGTYPALRVLKTMRNENRAHRFLEPGTHAYERAKTDMMECFCPQSPAWRRRVVRDGIALINRCVSAASG